MEDKPKEEEIKEEEKKIPENQEKEEEKKDTNIEEEKKDIINNEEQKKDNNIEEQKEKEKEKDQNIDSTEEKKEEKEEKEKIDICEKEKEERERKRIEEEKKEKEKKEKERKEKEEMEHKTFEQNLWNKYEYLHKRYKKKIECFENTIDIFSRLLGSLKDHQKVINTIISKNYSLFPQGESTQSYTINLIKKGIELEFNQLQTSIELLKKTLIDQFKKHKEESKIAEKDTYNQFLKILSKYTDSKTLLEKNKNKYHQSVKVAELALKNSKAMKVKNIDNSTDSQTTIQKLEDKAKELLNEAKKNYDKYIISLKEANKNREESIEKQKKLLNLYQSLEEKDGELLTNLLKDIYTRKKEETESTNTLLTEFNHSIEDINLLKDKISIINASISEDKPDPIIPLIQYEPQIDFEKASNPEDYKINHEVIKALKSAIPDIMPNFDIEKENQKQEMRELSKKIFVTNIPFTTEEKNKLMEYLQQKWSQTYFLIYLSKQRTNGRFARTQKLVKDLAEILNLILKTAEQEKDYYAAKNCMILSQTYYFDEKDKDGNSKKKYLLEFIINYKWLRTPDFWRGIIEEMISSETNKYMNLNKEEGAHSDKNNKKYTEQLSNICFSQLLPYANNMKEFYMDDRIILKIIDEFVDKYNVQKELAQSIYSGVISEKPEEIEKMRKEYKDNPNFENELMSLDEVKKQKGLS